LSGTGGSLWKRAKRCPALQCFLTVDNPTLSNADKLRSVTFRGHAPQRALADAEHLCGLKLIEELKAFRHGDAFLCAGLEKWGF
jgi:hypothetical protein